MFVAWTPHGSLWFRFFFHGTGGRSLQIFSKKSGVGGGGEDGWHTHRGRGGGGAEGKSLGTVPSPLPGAKGGLGFRRAGPLSFGDFRHGGSGLRKVEGGTGRDTWSGSPALLP